MSKAYYQGRVEPEDEIKNSITAGQFGAWQIKVMLQGDCDAPATMMRIMNTILLPYVTPDMLVYTFDHSSSRGKDRQTIGITARMLRRA